MKKTIIDFYASELHNSSSITAGNVNNYLEHVDIVISYSIGNGGIVNGALGKDTTK